MKGFKFKSKTLWANLIVAGLALFGLADEYSQAEVLAAVSAVNIALRFVTSESLFCKK